MLKPNSSGIIDAKNNFMSQPCKQSKKSTPYYKEFKKENYQSFKNMDEYMLDVGDKLSAAPISFKDKDFYVPELDLLPDGAFSIKEANDRKLRYNV